MGALVLRRLGLMVPTFLGITLLTFALARLAPGDPFQLDPEAAVIDTTAARARHGLDAPIGLQYARWLSQVVRLDFGRSLVDQRAVTAKLREALPGTALVSGLAWAVAYLGAVPLGVILATRRRQRWARAVAAALTLTWSVPSYWLAVLALLCLATPHGLQLFPMQGLGEGVLDVAWHLVLPVSALALPTLALATRQVRTAMITALGSVYVLAARGRGLPERRVVWHHALRNSLLPVVTMAGLSLPHVLSGSVVIERVFGLPGMGLLAFEAIGSRDYPTVMGVATLMAVVTMVSMLVIDLSYFFIDPRVRIGARA